jgi:predicted ATPase
LILARLSTLNAATRQLLMAAAVLGNLVTAKLVWQVADLPSLTGLEALEEAVKSGLLREMEVGRGRIGSYRFAHELERDVIYTEIGEARRHVLHLRALDTLTSAGAHAAELAYHAHEAGEIETALRYNILAGDEAVSVFAVKETIVYYEQARTLLHYQVEQTMLDFFQKMSPSRVNTRDIAYQAKQYSSRFPLIEHLYTSLSHAYTFLQEEEQAMEIYEELLAYARQQQNFPLIGDILNRHRQVHMSNLRFALASTYQAMQQWERARAIFEETLATSEGVLSAWFCIHPSSRLCMHHALRREWEQAYHYAMKAMTLRKRFGIPVVPLDFYRSYEVEALLQMGEETLAREEVRQMKEYLEPYRRFHIPYLRSLVVLARKDEQNEQAINHLLQAAQVATDLGLPAERWQIQATLGEVYEVCGLHSQADAAFREAADLLQNLAQGIEDEAQRALFVAGSFIQQILQRA